MLDEIWVPAVAGVAAGLGVAMPLGAIAALLLREGVVNGFRVAAAAAGGIALVDTTYCAAAMLAGALVAPQVEQYQQAFLVVSGLLVVAIGVRQLLGALRRRAPGDGVEADRTTALGALAKFVGLTAVNPMTLVYFVALAAAVAARSDSWVGPVVFVVATGLASLAWQLLLAALGSLLGRSLSARATEAVGVVASLVVVALGCGVLLTGLH